VSPLISIWLVKFLLYCAVVVNWSYLGLEAWLSMCNRLRDKGFDNLDYFLLYLGLERVVLGAIAITIRLVSIASRVVYFWAWIDTILVWCVCDSEGTLQVSPKRVYLVQARVAEPHVWFGLRCSPRRPWFGVERLSLAQAKDSSPKRGCEETWALLSAISRSGEKY